MTLYDIKTNIVVGNISRKMLTSVFIIFDKKLKQKFYLEFCAFNTLKDEKPTFYT